MRQNKLFKTTLLLLALAGGVSSAWADGTISIPQDLGSYIVLGTATGTSSVSDGVTITGCNIDSQLGDETNNRYYSVGSTGSSTVVTITINVTEAADYIFGFKTGAQNCTASLSLKLTDSTSQEVWTSTASVENTGSWTPVTNHYYSIGNLTAGIYTMTISTNSITSGSYAGNWGQFCFNTKTQLAMPLLSSSSYINLATGTYAGGRSYGGDNVGSIRNGASAEYVVYNSSESAKYLLDMGVSYYGEGTMTVTVTDMASGTVEVSQAFSIPNVSNYANSVFPLTTAISSGLKKIKFAFSGTGNGSGYILNYKNVTFDSYDEMPLIGATTTYLTLTKGIYGGNGTPRTENNGTNVGYVYNEGYAEYYANNENETAYYNLCIGMHRYQASSQLKVTITDLATSTIEDQETFDVPEVSSYATCTFKLSNQLTAGIKKIRFDFINTASNSYIFNYKNITFYKRSLNESYDYTAVAATGVDMVLTRSIAANSWSTIVLPFAMTSDQITSTFGDGTKVAQLTGISGNNLTFSSVTSMNVSLVLCGSLGSGETPTADISSAFESDGDEWADTRGGFFDD